MSLPKRSQTARSPPGGWLQYRLSSDPFFHRAPRTSAKSETWCLVLRTSRLRSSSYYNDSYLLFIFDGSLLPLIITNDLFPCFLWMFLSRPKQSNDDFFTHYLCDRLVSSQDCRWWSQDGFWAPVGSTGLRLRLHTGPSVEPETAALLSVGLMICRCSSWTSTGSGCVHTSHGPRSHLSCLQPLFITLEHFREKTGYCVTHLDVFKNSLLYKDKAQGLSGSFSGLFFFLK